MMHPVPQTCILLPLVHDEQGPISPTGQDSQPLACALDAILPLRVLTKTTMVVQLSTE